MKHRINKCLTCAPITDKDKWDYISREFVGCYSVFHAEYSYEVRKHRVSFFLSLHAHLRIEETLEALANLVFIQFPMKRPLLVYDVIHGIVSSYGMRQILEFWRTRG